MKKKKNIDSFFFRRPVTVSEVQAKVKTTILPHLPIIRSITNGMELIYYNIFIYNKSELQRPRLHSLSHIHYIICGLFYQPFCWARGAKKKPLLPAPCLFHSPKECSVGTGSVPSSCVCLFCGLHRTTLLSNANPNNLCRDVVSNVLSGPNLCSRLTGLWSVLSSIKSNRLCAAVPLNNIIGVLCCALFCCGLFEKLFSFDFTLLIIFLFPFPTCAPDFVTEPHYPVITDEQCLLLYAECVCPAISK